jgi:hypothetical protein
MLAAPASLACKENALCARKQRQGSRNNPAFPARWFTAYTWSPRCPGFVSHRRLPDITGRLDPSVGGSGPHDSLVRFTAARLAAPTRPPLPASNVRGDRDTPLLVETGCRDTITKFRKTEGKCFCKRGLTRF